MALQEKYKELIDAATAQGITNLQIVEQDNVLHVNGNAPTGAAKDVLWDVYGRLDPNFSSGDLVLNIDAGNNLVEGAQLNIRNQPGTDGEIVGKASHGDIVNFVRKENDQWWVIKTNNGIEGYAFSTYLTPIG